MLNIGKTSPQYLPSPILSKKIRLFNDHAVKLLPFLKQTTKFVELDTSSQTAEKSF
jgi:adenylate kinase family enzyme